MNAYFTGRILGRGSFCIVKEIILRTEDNQHINMDARNNRSIMTSTSTSTSCHNEDDQDVDATADATATEKTDECQFFALKQPRSDLSREEKLHADESLQNEIEYLSKLDHPNIIKLM